MSDNERFAEDRGEPTMREIRPVDIDTDGSGVWEDVDTRIRWNSGAPLTAAEAAESLRLHIRGLAGPPIDEAVKLIDAAMAAARRETVDRIRGRLYHERNRDPLIDRMLDEEETR